jgi:hypothetical protein
VTSDPLEITDGDGTVSVTVDGTVVLRYRAETPASKPHVDRLALPAGDTSDRNLVLAAPHDHAWHLGLFFCQKLIDGINCWGTELYAREGRTRGLAVDAGYEASAAGGTATVEHDVRWVTDDGHPLVDDCRTISIHEPDDRGYLLTWAQTVSAPDARRHLTSESIHGRYSGLSVRLRRSMADGRIRLPERDDPEDRSGPTAPWCDYTGAFDGVLGPAEPPEAGLTLMSRPDDPVNWYTVSGMPFVAANPTWGRTLVLEPGATRTWRWGVWVHDGRPDRGAIETAYDRFVDS